MTVASRSHGGNEAGGLLGEPPGQGEGWDPQAQLGTVQRLPPTRRRGQLPLASLDLPSVPHHHPPALWIRFSQGRTQRTQALSLTRSPLGPRNPSGPLSPLSPCNDKGGQGES